MILQKSNIRSFTVQDYQMAGSAEPRVEDTLNQILEVLLFMIIK